MIEIIYKEEQKKAEGNEQFFRIPNNIRQIGEIRGQQKIYIEDYAYTFLKKISRVPEEGGKLAILLGQYHWSEGSAYLFIKSALQVRDVEASPEHIVFNDKVWGQVYEDSRKYFPQQEIVGWFVSLPGFNMQINEVLLKTHLNHFAGNDKVLFAVEPGEWEEAFFVYEGNQLNRQPGYYIYYEKNEPMQAYMIDMSQNKSIEETEKVPDRAVIDFRRTVKQKDAKKENGKYGLKDGKKLLETEKENGDSAKKAGHLTWTLGACTAAAALALGITFFNSYKNMSGTLETLVPELAAEHEEESAAVDTRNVLTPTVAPDQSTPLISREDMNQAGTTKEDAETSEEDTEAGENSRGENSKGENGKGENAEENAGANPTDESLSQQENQGETQEEGQEESKEEAQGTAQEGAGAGSAGNGTQNVQETSGEVQTPQNTGGNTREYIIQRGDTLSSISKSRYGTVAKVEEICRLNGISPSDIIYAGQKLILPE